MKSLKKWKTYNSQTSKTFLNVYSKSNGTFFSSSISIPPICSVTFSTFRLCSPRSHKWYPGVFRFRGVCKPMTPNKDSSALGRDVRVCRKPLLHNLPSHSGTPKEEQNLNRSRPCSSHPFSLLRYRRENSVLLVPP